VKLKCLSVNQPYASAIIAGGKDIENRTWAASYRGPLLIHASANVARLRDDVLGWVRERCPGCPADAADFTLGKVIGIVTLDNCVDIASRALSRWAEGPVRWLVSRPVALPAFPARGKPGLFEVDEREIPGEARRIIRAYAKGGPLPTPGPTTENRAVSSARSRQPALFHTQG